MSDTEMPTEEIVFSTMERRIGSGQREIIINLCGEPKEGCEVGFMVMPYQYKQRRPWEIETLSFRLGSVEEDYPFIIPSFMGSRKWNYCILFGIEYVKDLLNFTDEVLFLMIRGFWLFRNYFSKCRGRYYDYCNAKMHAVKNKEIFPFELNADKSAVYYLGIDRVLAACSVLEKRLIDAPESETKEYELWELRERIKLLEGARNAKKRPLQNGDGGDSATD